MNKSILTVKNLSHKYSQDWAIRNINFEINQTGILGLLGSNGAGKSTTMNIMCGVLNQTEGQILIDGIDLQVDPRAAKQKIGFLPQTPPLHFEATVDEYLTYCANLRLIEPGKIKSAVQAAKERCGVAHFSNRLIRNLSGGYRQRVGIAQAIIHRPKLVVLDEPTNGLDPIQIIEVRNLIREIAEDRAVIFSSHILSEVQVLCKDIKMIEKGRMVFADTMEAFNNYIKPTSVLIQLEAPPKVEEIYTIPGVTKVEVQDEKYIRIFFEGSAEITERIIEKGVANSWHVREIILEKSSLDEIFAQLTHQEIK
jgi:ABC-2 type transport system ATP-binding protein